MRVTNRMWEEMKQDSNMTVTINGVEVQRTGLDDEQIENMKAARKLVKAAWLEETLSKTEAIKNEIQAHIDTFDPKHTKDVLAVLTYRDLVTKQGTYTLTDYLVLYKYFVMERKSIDAICRNAARHVQHAISWEDIRSEITARIMVKPSIVSEIALFHVRIKQLASNAIRGVVRDYKRYKPLAMDKDHKIREAVLGNSTKAFDRVSERLIDIQNMLTEDEYRVFHLFYVADLPMLEVDKIIGKRCDRIKDRVHAKVSDMISQVSEISYSIEETEKMDISILGNRNLPAVGFDRTYKHTYGPDIEDIRKELAVSVEAVKTFAKMLVENTVSKGINIGAWYTYELATE